MKTYTHYKSKIPKLLIFLTLISFSFMGGDCSKVLENSGTPPGELVGNWKLIEQQGALQDICPEETVNFQADGVAVLTCPNSAAVSRNYTVENNVVTYTQSSVSYQMEFLNSNNNLALYGTNVSRNLLYEKIVTDIPPQNSTGNSDSRNSSEIGGTK